MRELGSRVRISMSDSQLSDWYRKRPATAPGLPYTRARSRMEAWRRFFWRDSISAVDWKVDRRVVRRAR